MRLTAVSTKKPSSPSATEIMLTSMLSCQCTSKTPTSLPTQTHCVRYRSGPNTCTPFRNPTSQPLSTAATSVTNPSLPRHTPLLFFRSLRMLLRSRLLPPPHQPLCPHFLPNLCALRSASLRPSQNTSTPSEFLHKRTLSYPAPCPAAPPSYQSTTPSGAGTSSSGTTMRSVSPRAARGSRRSARDAVRALSTGRPVVSQTSRVQVQRGERVKRVER